MPVTAFGLQSPCQIVLFCLPTQIRAKGFNQTCGCSLMYLPIHVCIDDIPECHKHAFVTFQCSCPSGRLIAPKTVRSKAKVMTRAQRCQDCTREHLNFIAVVSSVEGESHVGHVGHPRCHSMAKTINFCLVIAQVFHTTTVTAGLFSLVCMKARQCLPWMPGSRGALVMTPQ